MIKKCFLASSWIKFELVKFHHVWLIHLAQAYVLCSSCTINDHDAFNLVYVYSPLFALHDHLSRKIMQLCKFLNACFTTKLHLTLRGTEFCFRFEFSLDINS